MSRDQTRASFFWDLRDALANAPPLDPFAHLPPGHTEIVITMRDGRVITKRYDENGVRYERSVTPAHRNW